MHRNHAADRWALAQDRARDIADEYLDREDACIYYDEVDELGVPLARESEYPGQLEDELDRVLRARGLYLSVEDDGYYARRLED